MMSGYVTFQGNRNRKCRQNEKNEHDAVFKIGRCELLALDSVWFHINVDVIHSHHFQFLNQLGLSFYVGVFDFFFLCKNKKKMNLHCAHNNTDLISSFNTIFTWKDKRVGVVFIQNFCFCTFKCYSNYHSYLWCISIQKYGFVTIRKYGKQNRTYQISTKFLGIEIFDFEKVSHTKF